MTEIREEPIFGEYAKQMLAIFTPEQLLLWRSR